METHYAGDIAARKRLTDDRCRNADQPAGRVITDVPSARCVSTNLLVVIAATNTAATNERDIITNAARNFIAVVLRAPTPSSGE